MLSTFLQVLPLSLGGAVNPFGILIIFFLLASKDRPLKRTWLFLLGSTIFLIVVVIVEHALLNYAFGLSHQQTSISSIVNIIFGIILILLAVFRKKKQKAKTKKTSNIWQELAAGFFFMAIDLTTLVLYFAAVKLVFDAKLSFVENVALFTFNIIIVMSTMALPPFLATIMPHKSAQVLDALNRFVEKRGQLISKTVIIIIAFYLIYKGVVFFF